MPDENGSLSAEASQQAKPVKAKAAAKRPRRVSRIRKRFVDMPGVPKLPTVVEEQVTRPESTDRFPDREPNIEEIDDYAWKDPTLLMKNGVPWTPEEHGWRARLCSKEARKHKGLGIWRKVRPEDGIVFADSGVTLNQSQGAMVEDAMFGEAADGIYRNGAFLCLAPLEQAVAKEKRQLGEARDIVQSSMLESAQNLQNKVGGNPRDSSFQPGPRMSRRTVRIPHEEMRDRAKMLATGRHSVTVPESIS